MPEYRNPFRPGAGHPPPYLAGRQSERQQVLKLLEQDVVFENASSRVSVAWGRPCCSTP